MDPVAVLFDSSCPFKTTKTGNVGCLNIYSCLDCVSTKILNVSYLLLMDLNNTLIMKAICICEAQPCGGTFGVSVRANIPVTRTLGYIIQHRYLIVRNLLVRTTSNIKFGPSNSILVSYRMFINCL